MFERLVIFTRTPNGRLARAACWSVRVFRDNSFGMRQASSMSRVSIVGYFQTDICLGISDEALCYHRNWCHQTREEELSTEQACLLTSTLYELSLDASVKGFDPNGSQCEWQVGYWSLFWS